jgi:SAM-dependent methyltransferase
MAHGAHDGRAPEEPASPGGLGLRELSACESAPVLGHDQGRAADRGDDVARNPDLELVGVDDLSPPATANETHQHRDDRECRHECLESRTSERAHLYPDGPQPVFDRLGDDEPAVQGGVPSPCDNDHIVQQRHRLCLITAEAAQTWTVGPWVPRGEDEDAKRRAYARQDPMTSLLRDAALVGLRTINHGDTHHCPICDADFARFMRRGHNLMCVGCRSFARHRLMVLYLQRETELLRESGRVLHIAPEPGVSAALSTAPFLDTVTLDVDEDADVQVHADARDLPFEDGSFDAVLCSHVLEHIPEDVEAAREMARVLRTDGLALIQVPVDLALGKTYETSAPTPADREREYGQHDHVRVYGPDVADRLDKAFGAVERVDYAASFAAAERRRMGLVEATSRRGEDIYVGAVTN